jgi:hypothetical protein
MKDLKEFVAQLVKIEFLDHCKAFGFYPFQMYVEDKEGKSNMVCLALGGDVRAVYTAFNDYFKENPKRIYLAVDFPANMDIINDFVCVIGYEKEEFTLYAIPYNVETGETLSDIRDAEILNKIHDDLSKFIW